MLDNESLKHLYSALETLGKGFVDLPSFDPQTDLEHVAEVLDDVALRLRDNYPYPHPFYAGQMLKPPHPVARLAYMLAMWINPNNHALDGSRASSPMEKEAVADLARMVGWDEHLGHLCGGGTMANLEALWVSGNARPGELVVASEQAHYTHGRISEVLKLRYRSVPTDSNAKMKVSALRELLETERVGTVVATLGTTGVGAVDPLPELVKLKETYGFRLHVDAAYGGYFKLVDTLDPAVRSAFDMMDQADSIVIDPHKHGLQPYGCGCVLFRDPSVGRYYKHDSPYTYFTSKDLHLGEISLECSRPGASAVALWATHKLLPPVPGGRFAGDLTKCRRAAIGLFEQLQSDNRFMTAFAPELDIVIWAPVANDVVTISQRSQQLFEAAARENLHFAVIRLPGSLMKTHWPGLDWNDDHVTCMRSCLMKPEHLEWLPRIWNTMDNAMDHVSD